MGKVYPTRAPSAPDSGSEGLYYGRRAARTTVLLCLSIVGPLLSIWGYGLELIPREERLGASIVLMVASLIGVIVVAIPSASMPVAIVVRAMVIIGMPLATWSGAGRYYGLIVGLSIVLGSYGLLDSRDLGLRRTGRSRPISVVCVGGVAAAQVAFLRIGRAPALYVLGLAVLLSAVDLFRPDVIDDVWTRIFRTLRVVSNAARDTIASISTRMPRILHSLGSASRRIHVQWRTWLLSLDNRPDDGHVTTWRTTPSSAVSAMAVVGFAIRFLSIVAHAWVPVPRDDRDPSRFIDLAENILAGHGMYEDGRLTTFWPPGYPSFVALWMKVQQLVGVGSMRFWVGFGQAVLGALMILAVGHLTRRHIGSGTAVLCALILALWPNMVIGTSVIMTEGVATPFYAFGIVALLWNKQPKVRELILAGVFLGMYLLARPAGLAVVAIAPSIAIVAWRKVPLRAVMSAAIVLLAISATVSPWLLYTNSAVGKPVLSSFMGFNMCMGNSDRSTGQYEPGICPNLEGENPVSADSRMRSEAFEWIATHPSRQPALIARRIRETFVVDFYSTFDLPNSDYRGVVPLMVVAVLTQAWWMAALYLGFRGGWVNRCRKFFVLAGVAWGAVLVGPLITIGESRFHDTFIPFMAICMADWIARSLRRTSDEVDMCTNPICSPRTGP